MKRVWSQQERFKCDGGNGPYGGASGGGWLFEVGRGKCQLARSDEPTLLNK